MKQCPNCAHPCDDNTAFCPECGLKFAAAGGAGFTPNPNPGYAPNPNPGAGYIPYDPYDHTSEYEPKDVSENKVVAMLVYLLGTIGVIIALLYQKSPFVNFHLRQALKFLVVEAITVLAMGILAWTFVALIVGAIFLVVLFVLKIVAFVNICGGKAKEPAIIRSIGFLK